MDLILIPQALLTIYGFVVLASGGVVGLIAGGNLKRHRNGPTLPDLFERRTELLGGKLEIAHSELSPLREEADFLRRLLDPEREGSRERPRSVA